MNVNYAVIAYVNGLFIYLFYRIICKWAFGTRFSGVLFQQ
jgi:hypothetical protein